MKSATADAPYTLAQLPPRRRLNLSALPALFSLTLRQSIRGRRLIVLSLLFLLPTGLAILFRFTASEPAAQQEFFLIYYLIPHALVPLAALLYSAGIIQDEVEEQTLTYLLLRPLPRWALYLTRLVATWLVTVVLTAVFTTLALVAIWWGSPQLWQDVLPLRAAKTAGVMALALLGYCSLFGAMGLLTRRSMIVGLGYIVAFEGFLANIPFMVRELTVMFYFRVLVARWLEPKDISSWKLKLSEAPTASACVQRLAITSVVLMILGALMMARREFRVKTPEGS
jgi:ABC-2 type transport system permease protein